eukprot:TRINITY_DN1238_c0_g2_i1.p1 TRINITY_DN1238_c0_g2~~TRINITY_DN1238_c0_g2_i1.p1  ORF type:complete len:510 (-),score=76.97 TRINITY_DN1238_c0_g2_i1:171-1700(-)
MMQDTASRSEAKMLMRRRTVSDSIMIAPMVMVIVTCVLLHVKAADADVDAVYSLNYKEADARFTDACVALAHADPTVVHAAYPYHATSPEGEALYARVCVFGDVSASTAFLVISGVHGAEMYAPAAVQLRVMRDHLVPFNASDTVPRLRIPSGVRAVFVHAISPWGGSWGFKEGHSNIDMLKNINGIYNVSASYKSPTLVKVLDGMDLRNAGTVEGFLSGFQFYMTVASGPEGPQLLKELSYGQNERQIGLSYYGAGAAWERQTLYEIVDRYLDGACKILLADLHTAAGRYGDWFIAAFESSSEQQVKKWNQDSGAGATIEPIANAGVGTEPWPFYEFVKELHPDSDYVRVVWEAGTFPQANYEVDLLMGVYCRYYGDLDVSEAGCEAFFSTFNPADWTGPCCKFHHERIQEFFNPHKGAYADWPGLTYEAAAAPFRVMAHGLEEMQKNPKTCEARKKVTESGGTDSGEDISTGDAVLISLACVLISISVVGVFLIYRQGQRSRSQILH